MKPWLKERLAEIAAVRVDDSLSDGALAALTAIHQSLASLAASEPEGTESEARETLAQLCAQCVRRSAGNQRLTRRGRMLPLLFHLFSQTDTPFDEARYAVCLRRTFRLAEDWHRKWGAVPDCDLSAKQRDNEYDLLRCLVEAFRYADEADRREDPDYRYLATRLTAWLSAMEADGSWRGISDREAVRRLDVLTSFEPFINDSTADPAAGYPFTKRIAQSVNVYFARTVRSIDAADPAADAETLYQLYQIVQYGLTRPDEAKAAQIARWAVRKTAPALPGAAETLQSDSLWALAIVLDHECQQQNQRLKTRLLACSA